MNAPLLSTRHAHALSAIPPSILHAHSKLTPLLSTLHTHALSAIPPSSLHAHTMSTPLLRPLHAHTMSTPLLSILHAHTAPINISDHDPTLCLVTPDLSNPYLTPRLKLTHAPPRSDVRQTTHLSLTHTHSHTRRRTSDYSPSPFDALIRSGARPPLQQTIKHYHDSSPLATSSLT